jgi:hypothetical protein
LIFYLACSFSTSVSLTHISTHTQEHEGAIPAFTPTITPALSTMNRIFAVPTSFFDQQQQSPSEKAEKASKPRLRDLFNANSLLVKNIYRYLSLPLALLN